VKLIVDEDWDDDFAADDLKVLSTKVNKNYKPIPSFTNNNDTPSPTFSPSPNITGTITRLGAGGSINKKPFELLKSDAPHRRSFQILPNIGEKKSTKIAWEDEDESGLDIPTGPLRLKPQHEASTNSHEVDEILDDEDDALAQGDPENGVEATEVEEEDWDDVVLPPVFGDPVTKRPPVPPQARPTEVEEWNEFDVPVNVGRLELKVSAQNHQQRQTKSTRGRGGDDDDFDGLDIPEGVPLRLKR